MQAVEEVKRGRPKVNNEVDSKKSRHYCWTWFIECSREQAVDQLESYYKLGGMVYLLGGFEQCPTTGRLHIQGYMQFESPRSFASVKKSFHLAILNRCHIEPCKGDSVSNLNYCTKNSDHFCFGQPDFIVSEKKPGRRTDLEEIKKFIDEGHSIREVSERYFATFLKYERSLRSYYYLKKEQKPRDFMTELHIYYGASGTGKSGFAKFENPDAYFLPKPNGESIFFDGYEGQDVVIIDDFYGWLPWSFLLNMCDRYPMRVNYKGGSVNFAPKKIIISSNKHYTRWYKRIDDLTPLVRRITSCLFFKSKNEVYDETPEVFDADKQVDFAFLRANIKKI